MVLTIFLLAGLSVTASHADKLPQFGAPPEINFKITGITMARSFLVFLCGRCVTEKFTKGMPSWCL